MRRLSVLLIALGMGASGVAEASDRLRWPRQSYLPPAKPKQVDLPSTPEWRLVPVDRSQIEPEQHETITRLSSDASTPAKRLPPENPEAKGNHQFTGLHCDHSGGCSVRGRNAPPRPFEAHITVIHRYERASAH